MSNIEKGQILTTTEQAMIDGLNSLHVSGTNEGIAKISATTFENRTFSTSGGGVWGSITGTLSNQLDLQSALDLKANIASPTFTGTVTLPSTTSIGNVSATEISYLDGVTSALQTQLDSKISGLTIGTTTITGGTTTRILYDNAGVVGEYTLTGTGTVVAMQTAPTFLTSITVSAANIITDTTTGTKIGTATNQKLGFFNSAPIVQPTGDVVTALQNLGLGASLTIAADTVKSADEASDTTCFPLFITASGTQTLATKNNTNLTFNSSTAVLGSTIFNAGTGYQIGGAASSGKILKANGTNFVASTETYAAPGTSGNVMTSDGTNWTSAAPSSGALTWAGGDSVERSGNSTGADAITLSSVSGLSLASGTPVELTFRVRRSTGATTTGRWGLKINSTQVLSTGVANGVQQFQNLDEVQDMYVKINLMASDGNYTHSIIIQSYRGNASGSAGNFFAAALSAVLPTATITSITITGDAVNSSITVYSDNLNVYKYATS